jgi:hypothetical protein
VARRPLASKAPRAHELSLASRAPEVSPPIAEVAPPGGVMSLARAFVQAAGL